MNNDKPKILAVSASLRNARWGTGVSELLAHIKSIKNRDNLHDFLDQEAKIHFQQFLDAGRAKGLPFDKLYANLKKDTGRHGLCNSEIGMVTALWAAYQTGCDIDYVPLSSYFGSTGNAKKLDELKSKILSADGLLLCTPVYFGDRSSLASDFIELIRVDKALQSHLTGKPMAGIAVGAKRNGGQETTLIYQLIEMTGIGMMGLGNDSETTSQYGGTIKAGDIGTAVEDDYGLNTSIGTGRRLGSVAYKLALTKKNTLTGKLKVQFWILQDNTDDFALKQVKQLIQLTSDSITPSILELSKTNVGRCIACDICPTHVGPDSEYRCIIHRKVDEFTKVHELFLDHDLIVPVVLSSKNRSGLQTIYQRFIERTRYLRRGDYLFSDVAVMPLVFEEIGATENMHIRMLTSMIRHHTVMLRPNVGYINQGEIINWNDVKSNWLNELEQAKEITLARISPISHEKAVSYNPVGYVLSAAADQELSLEERQKMIHKDREKRIDIDAKARIQQE